MSRRSPAIHPLIGCVQHDCDKCKATAAKLQKVLQKAQIVTGVVLMVENRCMAVDGPVTPTHKEITDAEIKRMYDAGKSIQRYLKEILK